MFEEPRTTNIEQLPSSPEFPYIYKLEAYESKCLYCSITVLCDWLPVFLLSPTVHHAKNIVSLKKNLGRIYPADIHFDGDMVDTTFGGIRGNTIGYIELYDNKLIFNIRWSPGGHTNVFNKINMGLKDWISNGTISLNDQVTIFSDIEKDNTIFNGQVSDISNHRKVVDLFLENQITGEFMYGTIQSVKLGESLDVEFSNPPSPLNGIYSIKNKVH